MGCKRLLNMQAEIQTRIFRVCWRHDFRRTRSPVHLADRICRGVPGWSALASKSGNAACLYRLCIVVSVRMASARWHRRSSDH